ncbi:MAG: cobyric acid synthase [Geminicoccaceae bacterium]|nr:MAG: cobyric acid synthase [Geminicoccaceae bacterium]
MPTNHRALMLQGTGSNVGKSLLVAGLCRALGRRGLRVAPFKPQNMSNNAAVTVDGGEIGRAQALQALAAGVPAHTDMNPVLLKPETERGAQVVVQGRMRGRYDARAYHSLKPELMPAVLASFERLKAAHDLVLVEGAGSPAEVNLRQGDIANMGFAKAAAVPVVLVGDIERGGVIAALVGTVALLEPDERALLRGYIVNRFRGDPSLFDGAHPILEARTGLANLGVVTWFDDAWRLPAEDVMDLDHRKSAQGAFKIAVPRTPRIANFDDLDPLAAEPGVTVEIVRPGRPLPANADLVLLPGSKATRSDLAAFRREGWDIDLRAHVRRGGRVLGLCGGYQMLGRSIADPDGIEGAPGSDPGLGLLAIDTVLTGTKTLTTVQARAWPDGPVATGYEMHVGLSDGPDRQRPAFAIDDRSEGAMSPDGRIVGTYLHGLFAADAFRRWLLTEWGASASSLAYAQTVETTLDRFADQLERELDLDRLLEMFG